MPCHGQGWRSIRSCEDTQPGQLIPSDQSDIPYCTPPEYKMGEEAGHGLLLVEWLGIGRCMVSSCIGHHLFCMLKFFYLYYYNLLLELLWLSPLSATLNCLYFSPWSFSLSLFWFPLPSCLGWGIGFEWVTVQCFVTGWGQTMTVSCTLNTLKIKHNFFKVTALF